MKLSLFHAKHSLRKLIELPRRIKHFLAGRLSPTNELFEKYEIGIIRLHIRELREGQSMTRYERERDSEYQRIRKRYEDHYCPPDVHHEELSWENQVRYLWLRLEIDEGLDDSRYIYNS